MKSSFQFAASLAMFAGAQAAAVAEPGPNATPHQYPIIYSTYTSFASPDVSIFTHKPTATPGPQRLEAQDNEGWSMVLFNSAGYPLSLSYQSGSVSTDGTLRPVPSPTIGGQDGTLPAASATQFAAPAGWNGRVTIGIAGAAIDSSGSLIEGSFPNAQAGINVDVSYVNGYSAPIMCYGPNSYWLSGCPINLFDNGNECPDWSSNGDVCINQAILEGKNCGPSPKFFNSCQGLAYTFPYDDRVDSNDQVPVGDDILCCVDSITGPANNCPRPNGANPSLGYGQKDAQCSGLPAQSKRGSEKRKRAPEPPVDPAEGHWWYNSTLFQNYQAFRVETGKTPIEIPASAFKKH